MEESSGSSSSSGMPVTEPEMVLTDEQRTVHTLAMQGRSIFFTGSAGTGKSFLMRKIIADLKAKYAKESIRDAVFVTAPTGMAACNIGGTTLHAFAGLSIQNKSKEKMAAAVQSNKACKARWVSCRTLVVDEVSMVDGEMFDKLDYVARTARGSSSRPFGGIQVILAGDFYQLPPIGLDQVESGKEKKQQHGDDEPHKPAIFCFESKVWNSLLYAQVSLQQVFRQSDPRFVTILNEMRVGKLSKKSIEEIRDSGAGLKKLELANPKLKATKLFAVNSLVDRLNDDELQKCPGDLHKFKARDDGEVNELRHMAVPIELDLKLGAQVMLLKNLNTEAGLVNGARGYVAGFEAQGTPQEHPLIIFERPGQTEPSEKIPIPRSEFSFEMGTRTIATRSQIPLKLAYAISIHKSQGMTIDCLDVCLEKVFEFGQAYVALSRAVSIDRLRVSGFNPSHVKTHPRVITFYNGLLNASSSAAADILKKSTVEGQLRPEVKVKVKSIQPPTNFFGPPASTLSSKSSSSTTTSSMNLLPSNGIFSLSGSDTIASRGAQVAKSSASSNLVKSETERLAQIKQISGGSSSSSSSSAPVLAGNLAPVSFTASQEQEIEYVESQ